jgi:hypothetical protein
MGWTKGKKRQRFSEEHNKNLAESLRGRKLSQKHIDHLIESKTGKHLSLEHRKSLSIAVSLFYKNNPIKYKKQTDESNRKRRISVLKHIEINSGGKSFTLTGKHETQLLNEQEHKDNCKILRQYQIKDLGYIVDGYCKESNTVYEVYEKWHRKKIEHDLKRQKEIEQYLKCKFVAINDLL